MAFPNTLRAFTHALASSVAVAGCLGLSAVPARGQAETMLRVADQKGLQRALLDAAHALDGVPYAIDWSEFPAAAPLLQALSADAVDTGVAGDAPFLFAYEAGNDVRATTALLPRAAGRMLAVIVPAASPIKTAADLAGHRVATGRGSIGHELLLRLEQSGGVPAEKLEILFLSPAQAAAALHAGSIDAWSTWQPYIALEEQNGARPVVYATGLATIYSFQVSNSRALASKHAMLADFYTRLGKAYAWGVAHPHDYAALWSKQMGLPLAVAEKVAGDMLTQMVPIDQGIVATEQSIIDSFRRGGVVPGNGRRIEGAFDRSFGAH